MSPKTTTTTTTDEEELGGAERPAGGEKVSGGFNGPVWSPQLAELNDKRKGEELTKLRAKNPRSTAQQKLRGKLCTFMAWGRTVYGLDVALPGGELLRVKLPEHTTLYTACNTVRLGADVFIECMGRGKAANGRQAPLLYDVVVAEKKDAGVKREDALTIERREDADDVAFPPKE